MPEVGLGQAHGFSKPVSREVSLRSEECRQGHMSLVLHAHLAGAVWPPQHEGARGGWFFGAVGPVVCLCARCFLLCLCLLSVYRKLFVNHWYNWHLIHRCIAQRFTCLQSVTTSLPHDSKACHLVCRFQLLQLLQLPVYCHPSLRLRMTSMCAKHTATCQRQKWPSLMRWAKKIG